MKYSLLTFLGLSLFLCSAVRAGIEKEGTDGAGAEKTVNLVLSDGLYRQMALQYLKEFDLLGALDTFSRAMAAFELMRSEFKCYLKDDLSDEVNKEITQGLEGVDFEEFSKRSASIPEKTKQAYLEAASKRCLNEFKWLAKAIMPKRTVISVVVKDDGAQTQQQSTESKT